MITFKVLKMSPSGKSAFCKAIVKVENFDCELGAGYVAINAPVEVGIEVKTPFTKVTTRETSNDAGEICTWLVPSL